MKYKVAGRRWTGRWNEGRVEAAGGEDEKAVRKRRRMRKRHEAGERSREVRKNEAIEEEGGGLSP